MSDDQVAHRGLLVTGRILATVLTATVMLASGAGWWYLSSADERLRSSAVSGLVPHDPSIRAVDVPARARAVENFLILGLDTRPADQVAPGTGTSQSDVMIIAHVSADRSRVDLVSIPRDLIVPAPNCKAWDYATNTLSDRDFDNPYAEWKITNAYAVGGPQCTVKAVQALTGLRIDRLIVLDFKGFESIVDAMGGVTMSFDGPVVDNGRTVIEHGGTQLINGDQALALVRARRVAGDPTGDLGRIGRQQALLTAMLTQATTGGVLGDPARLNSTVQTILDNSMTDNVTVQDLVDLVISLRGDNGTVNDYTLPTVPDPATDGLRAADTVGGYLDALVADQPLPAGS